MIFDLLLFSIALVIGMATGYHIDEIAQQRAHRERMADMATQWQSDMCLYGKHSQGVRDD